MPHPAHPLGKVTMAEPQKNKQWQWKPLSYRARTWAGALGAVVTYCLGASLLLNPMGVTIMAIGVAAMTTWLASKNRTDPRYNPSGAFAAPPASLISRLTREIAGKMGMEDIPRVFIKHAQPLDAITLFGGDTDKIRKALENDYSAWPQQNIIEAREEAIRTQPSARKLNYILAHELSHIKNDKNNPAILARAVTSFATPALAGVAISIGILTGASLLAAGLTAGKAVLGLLLMTKGSKLFSHYGIRVTERLADRNAMYITRDFNAAAAMIKDMHGDMPFDRKMPLLVEISQTHPIGLSRIQSLRKSWEEAISYPPLRAGDPVNDNAPAEDEKPGGEARVSGNIITVIRRGRA